MTLCHWFKDRQRIQVWPQQNTERLDRLLHGLIVGQAAWPHLLQSLEPGVATPGMYICRPYESPLFRTRLCWRLFRRTSTNCCSVKRGRGLCCSLTLCVCLFQEHVLRQQSERSVWQILTSGTHCRSTFATLTVCPLFVTNWRHTILQHLTCFVLFLLSNFLRFSVTIVIAIRCCTPFYTVISVH